MSADGARRRPARSSPHVGLAGAARQLRQAGAEATGAWSDERLSSTTTMPWGQTYTGAALVEGCLDELMAHAWDLAVATGQTAGCAEDLATAHWLPPG